MTVDTSLESRRIPPTPPELYEPLFGEDAPAHLRAFAWSPKLAMAVVQWMEAVYTYNSLDPRLVELIRLRSSFHNQCRTCMATRNQDVGVTEEDVCSLERPEEAADLTEAERAALAFLDLFATNHHAITDETYARVHEHFTPAQVIELGVLCAGTNGVGRLLSTFDIVENLPARFQENRGERTTPWGQGDVMVNDARMSGKVVHVPGIHRA